MMRSIRLHVWLIVCLALATPAWAQFETGAVVGTVRDNSGAVVPGATVTLLNTQTGVSVTKTTDAEGNYEFFTVRPGTYKVTAELSGFATAFTDQVQVSVGGRQRVDLTMKVGELTEAVEVVGGARMLETESSQRGQVISGRQAAELPLNGREYSSLTQLSPGVRLSALNTGGLTPREGAFNVNGLRSTFNNFLIDGVDNNAYGTSNQGFSNQVMQPPPDALAEFRVVTNNMSAEYGRSGGATINVAYKSGTNAYSGAGWEFFRDTSMNAEGFFKSAAGKPKLKRNQFGFVFGGPILKNKAFFFTDYEGFRQDRELVTFSTIPSEAQRQGILSVDVRNPLTGAVYPAGTPIPMTSFARKVLGDLPATTTGAAGANNYRLLQLFTNNTDKYNGKVDVTISPSLSAFGRYGYRDVDVFDNPPLPLPSGGSGNAQTYVTNKQFASGATWAQSGSSLLEMRFGYSYTVAGKSPAALGSASALDAYGLAGLPNDPRVSGGLPTQLITGYSDLGRQATNPQWQYPRVFNPKVNYSWVMTRHSFKSGYEFQHVETEVQDVNPLYGRDTYSGRFTGPAGTTNNLYSLADFMLGLRSQYALSNILVANLRQNMHFLYLQDDWRVNDKLTLNLGLRYEYATPWVEEDNRFSNYDPATKTMVLARDGSLADRALVDPDRNNFGPRLGFAYSLDPKTVVRGGYGMAYIHFHRAGGANILAINGPQVINAVVNQSPTQSSTPFLPAEQGYPAGLTDPSRFVPTLANITYIPKDYHSSGVQSWFISMQREVLPRTMVDVAYVGNRADDLLLFANYNQALPNNAAGTIPLAARRPIPEFGDITYSFNGGFSRYHSLQVKFESRLFSGLTLLNSLTLSKATDNGSGSLENQNGNAPAPQDFYNLAADEGYSNYHQPYNNTTSVIWELPFGHGRRWMHDASPWLDAVAGGWMVSGISFFYSGEPVTFVYTPGTTFQVSGIQQDFRGANNYRPNVVGDPYGDTNAITGYFNAANVVIPTDPSQPFGNAERNSVHGPLFWQIDFVAAKNFALPIGARTQVQFRIEAFNLLNRTNFRVPNGNRSMAGFGTITSTYDPRQLQLGLKVSF